MIKFGSLILMFVLVSCATDQVGVKQLQVGALQDQNLADGCGCYLKDANNSAAQYFYWNDFGNKHFVSINKKDIGFESCEKSGSAEKKGDTQVIQCKQGGVSLRVLLTKTSICEPDHEGCEFTARSGSIEVNAGSLKKVSGLVGGCGC